MNLTLPGGMGGKEVVGKVLDIQPAARLLVSSGYALDPVMTNSSRYGFSGVITKPFSI